MEVDNKKRKEYNLVKRSMGLEYQVPVYYVLGENDQQTPVELSRAYFRRITAPKKRLYFVKHAGHSVMLDQTKAYRAVICRIIQEIT